MTIDILGTNVRVLDLREASAEIMALAKGERSHYVCVANVHMVMEGHKNDEFLAQVNGATLVVPDGLPLVWVQRLFGRSSASRVYGPDLMLQICEDAETESISIALIGSTDFTLQRLKSRLLERYPRLQIACAFSPAFDHPLHVQSREILDRISHSKAQVVCVAFGCPKQEQWMSEVKESVPCVMVGLGAAFDFIAGTKLQAPRLVQRLGLEWLFRLATEPRRLWRRYLTNNPAFVFLIAKALVKRYL